MVETRPVTCQGRECDQYDVLIVVCCLNDVDLNSWMIRQGWEKAYRRCSRDYVSAQAQAEA